MFGYSIEEGDLIPFAKLVEKTIAAYASGDESVKEMGLASSNYILQKYQMSGTSRALLSAVSSFDI